MAATAAIGWAVFADNGEGVAPGSVFRDCDQCPEMVVIPAGHFMMGSPASEQGRANDEGPQRKVAIPLALAVGKYEVTRAEYAVFAQETARDGGGCREFRGGWWQEDAKRSWQNPGFDQTQDHPVTCVSWDDAKAYVAWLSRRTGRNYRLLTEAEWEYAARGGVGAAYFWGENADASCRYANGADQTGKGVYASWDIADCSDGHVHTAPVGSFEANAFGLHDMAGNLWEWTEDCWNASYDGAPIDGAARSSGECERRVLRGGAWDNHPRFLRSAFRGRGPASDRYPYDGFRVAR